MFSAYLHPVPASLYDNGSCDFPVPVEQRTLSANGVHASVGMVPSHNTFVYKTAGSSGSTLDCH